MEEHTLTLLEFPRIVAQVAEHCLSPGGCLAVAGQTIETDPDLLKTRLDHAAEFRALLQEGPAFPQLTLPDLATVVEHPRRVGSVFEPEELGALGTYILSATKLRRHLVRAGGALGALAQEIPDLTALSAVILRHVEPDGAIKEKSIPELVSIRARIRAIRQDVEGVVARLLGSPESRDWWQSDVPTIRNSRTVLPLKATQRGRIHGIVHEVSQSGATVFVEPEEVVEKNNEVVHQEAEYQRVVMRILREIALRVSERADEVVRMVGAVTHLDTLYARARYAILTHGSRPEVVQGVADLVEARHPLLGSTVVPTTVSLGGDGRVVIVTGPNTGGKTVVLKTLGIMALMHQFGLEIPVAPGSRLGVFDAVYADIGDEQSMEQSLSTFSGHIVNLARIVQSSTTRSLVLLDELGAGTDPEEGVAIAMSLLDHFIAKGCLTCVTTHHGILKNYGYSKPGVRNACMEFDSARMSPTYRLIMGLPGRSYAVEIARRNGLPEELIQQSLEYLRNERSDVGELIRSLSAKQEELHHLESAQRRKERDLTEQRREVDLRELRLRQRERELRKQGLRELDDLIAQSRRDLEKAIRELRQSGESVPGAAGARDLIRAAEEHAAGQREHLSREGGEPARAEDLPAIQPGMEVSIGNTGKRGTVVRASRKGYWLVATDTVRAEIGEDRLRPVPPSTAATGVDVESTAVPPPAFQLDVRGLTLEEALGRLDQQIERALRAGLAEFSVIHGKGEGVLQRGVHDRLRAESSVADYYFASPMDGGFGKTIVRLMV